MKTKTRGQALVEFALILPILLLLILGIIEGARIIWAYITVQNAAREAARYAVTGQPYDDLGNPWTMRPDRYAGCNPQFNNGQLVYSPDLLGGGDDCPGPNDRVDAIIGVALERGRQLGVDQYAIDPGVYTATGYVNTGGTFGVQVYGQETGTDTLVNYAGKEGLNVLVQVYYNVRLLDPLYAAIIPDGYVHLGGEVQMQNEGIDSALGSLPPAGIEPPQAPEGSEYQPGQSNPPVVLSLDGSSVNAGDDLRVKLEYHIPGERYDVYLYSPSLGYVDICLNLVADSFGSVAEATCSVRPATTAGSYQLVSIPAGGQADPANHVGEGDFVDVLFPDEPQLTILQSNRWPRGSSITFELAGHPPCPPDKSPCPPYQEYDVALIGGIYASPGQVIGTVRVNEFGYATLDWTIPNSLAPGTYTVVTYERNTTDPVIDDTTLDVVEAKIVVQGGNRWPGGTSIRVHLRGHAPNRTYQLRWIDGQTGLTTDFGPVTTDQFGNSEIPVQFRIPQDTADSSPTVKHRIISFEQGGSGEEVASEEVEVFTPEGAFIIVVGGDLWPAGSLIQIELHQHFNGPYDLFFENTDGTDSKLIEGDLSPNASGFLQTTYVVPIETADGTYQIRSERTSDEGTEATTPIEVESVPLIRLREGDTVQPGADVTIQLLHHATNDSFQIFLDGNYLFSMPTNAVGSGERVYDLDNLPWLEGGPFLLESRMDERTIASTEIFIVAPDLEITNIQFPPGPPVNQEIEVIVTVRNNSPVAVSGEYFDVDLYLDPLHPPTTSSQFPPGDYKRWVPSIQPEGVVDVVFNLTLRGTDHIVYGRVDTSNYIRESNEINNIYQMMVSGGCIAEIGDALNSAANWTGVGYGDADSGSFSVGGGRINLESDGSSDFESSDNVYLVYYSPSTISEDFEVRVRMIQGPGEDAGERDWAKAGLEIRGDVGNASSTKVELAVANSQHVGYHAAVLSAFRDGGGATRPGDAALDAAVAYPVWLRLVRSGDRFLYYYSDSDSATPPADNEWIAHGSVELASIGETVTLGLFNTSYDASATDTSAFDNFHICLKGVPGPPPGGDYPPGLTVCSGNLLGNSGFENAQLSPWMVPNGAVNKNPEYYEGQFSALMYTYITGGHQQPEMRQTFSMPEWVISSTTTVNLSLYTCVRDYAGSGAEPDDQLNAGLWSTGSPPALISSPVQVANGGTTNSGPCLPGDFEGYKTDLADAIKAAGGNPEDYAGGALAFSLYDFSSDLGVCNRSGGGPNNPACYETDFRVDNVELEVCTTQPIPPQEPGKAIIGGPLRVFVGGAPRPGQGVRVWTYQRNGELITTYSLDDSNYFFYNIEPGEYVIYAEYWDGPNLYSAITTVVVRADQTITDLSLLLR